MTPIFPPPAPVLVPIADGAGAFPVRRVYCVGRNYADHAREMGSDPDREPPFFFSKFPDAVVPGGGAIPYPPRTADFHYEGELVVAIGGAGRDLAADAALGIVYGYAAGLDMTRRDLQAAARKDGRPWDMAKNFTGAAPMAAIHPAEAAGHPARGALSLTVNGEERQRTDLSQMIWSVPEIIAHLSSYDALAPGDLIFTGTPAGVGPVRPGDVVEVTIKGLTALRVVVGT